GPPGVLSGTRGLLHPPRPRERGGAPGTSGTPAGDNVRGDMDRASRDALFDRPDRVAIVTGGTRGIGLAIAEGYVAAGAKVVVASRKPEACEETEAHLAGLGGEALGVPTHLGDLDALAALVGRTVDRFGHVDIVVNNAANALTLPLGALPPGGG